MEIKKITISGVGDVGSLYGSMLDKALGSNNVELLAKGDRLERYKKDGIIINGEKHFYNVVDPKDATPSDFVLLVTKNLQIDEAVQDIRNSVGKNTIILSLLNGIESEEKLIAEYGKENVLYAFCVGMSTEHHGNITNYTSTGKIVFGEKNNEISENVKAVKALFEKAKIEYLVPANIRKEQYNKFMLNTMFNTLSAITRGGYGVFASEALKEMSHNVALEIIAVLKMEGINLTEEDFQRNLDLMLSLDPYGKTSMCQDMIASRKTENNWFAGTVVRLGKKHGIPTPYNNSLYLIASGCEYRNEMMINKED
jgi:2-dehydropantoate 2-reductase